MAGLRSHTSLYTLAGLHPAASSDSLGLPSCPLPCPTHLHSLTHTHTHTLIHIHVESELPPQGLLCWTAAAGQSLQARRTETGAKHRQVKLAECDWRWWVVLSNPEIQADSVETSRTAFTSSLRARWFTGVPATTDLHQRCGSVTDQGGRDYKPTRRQQQQPLQHFLHDKLGSARHHCVLQAFVFLPQPHQTPRGWRFTIKPRSGYRIHRVFSTRCCWEKLSNARFATLLGDLQSFVNYPSRLCLLAQIKLSLYFSLYYWL